MKTCIVLSAALIVACTGRLEPTQGGDGDGDGDVDAATGPTPEEMQFTNTVLPLIELGGRDKGACTGCHTGAVGPIIFGANNTTDTAYSVLLAHPTMLRSPAETSGMLARGDHDGNAFCTAAATPDAYCTEDEVSIITAWIAAEISAGRVGP